MSSALAIASVILCLILKYIILRYHPERPKFYCKNKKFLHEILKKVPRLNEPYKPPRLWGFSGHFQAIVENFLTELFSPTSSGERIFLKASDGATVAYDLYRPSSDNAPREIMIAICPGITSSSESPYVRRVVFNACKQGLSVAVLNHVGVLKSIKLRLHQGFLIVNLVLWKNRLYLIGVLIGVHKILQRCRKELFTEQIKKEHNVNEEMVLSASTIFAIDENYTRRVLKFDTTDEMYRNMSCINYWSGIEKPMIFINAVDDPLFYPRLLNNVRDATKNHENFLYIEMKYGGHCSFFEGGFVLPNWLTWLDHTVAELVLALEEYTSEQNFELKYDEGTAFQPKTNCDQMLVNEKEIARREVNDIKSTDPLLPSYLHVINMQESRPLIPVLPLSIWQKIKAFCGNKTLLRQQELRRAFKQNMKEGGNHQLPRAGKASYVKHGCQWLGGGIHSS